MQHRQKTDYAADAQGGGPLRALHGAWSRNFKRFELLAVIIRTGSRESTSLELAQQVLKTGGEEGLLHFFPNLLKNLSRSGESDR